MSQKNVDINNYPIITTIHELSNYYSLNLDHTQKYETSKITKYPDGSRILEYTYDMTDSSEFDALYYSITVQNLNSIEEAKSGFKLGKWTSKKTCQALGLEVIEIDTIQLPSDQYYYSLTALDGAPNGMLLFVRYGTKLYSMMNFNFYSPNHSFLIDLIAPKLNNLKDFELIES